MVVADVLATKRRHAINNRHSDATATTMSHATYYVAHTQRHTHTHIHAHIYIVKQHSNAINIAPLLLLLVVVSHSDIAFWMRGIMTDKKAYQPLETCSCCLSAGYCWNIVFFWKENLKFLTFLVVKPGPWFNIRMTSYQYRKFQCGDKTTLRPSYLHNGISYAGKMTSLYWIGAQDIPEELGQHNIWCSSAPRFTSVSVHYSDVIMSAMVSEITGVSIVCSTVCADADQRKHPSSVWGNPPVPGGFPSQRASNAENVPLYAVIMNNVLHMEDKRVYVFRGSISAPCTILILRT